MQDGVGDSEGGATKTRPAWLKLVAVLSILLVACGLLVYWHQTRYERFVRRELTSGIVKATWQQNMNAAPFVISDPETLSKLALWLQSARPLKFGYSYPGTQCRLRLDMADGRCLTLKTSKLDSPLSYKVIQWEGFARIADKPDFLPSHLLEPPKEPFPWLRGAR